MPILGHDALIKARTNDKFNQEKIYLFSSHEKFQEFFQGIETEIGKNLLEADIDIVEAWCAGKMPDTSTIKNLIAFIYVITDQFLTYDVTQPMEVWEAAHGYAQTDFVNDTFNVPLLHYVDQVFEIMRVEGKASRDAQGWDDLLAKLTAKKYEDPAFTELWAKVLREMEIPTFKESVRALVRYFHKIIVIDGVEANNNKCPA
jgi:hypothetical protein